MSDPGKTSGTTCSLNINLDKLPFHCKMGYFQRDVSRNSQKWRIVKMVILKTVELKSVLQIGASCLRIEWSGRPEFRQMKRAASTRQNLLVFYQSR